MKGVIDETVVGSDAHAINYITNVMYTQTLGDLLLSAITLEYRL